MGQTATRPMARSAPRVYSEAAAMQTPTNSTADRVRRHTRPSTAESIAEATRRKVRDQAARSRGEIGQRIAELEQEWDVERVLEANASTLALTGAVLGTTVNKAWFWLTGTVLTFLFQHATSGWCPPLPVIRKLGVRTQAEIDQELFALKAVRGDFRDGGGDRPMLESTIRTVTSTESAAQSLREPDRVRRYTPQEQLRQIDAGMERRVRLYASQPAELITERIAELRREWSIERYLQVNVALVGLSTAALAVTKHRNWGIATCAGLGFFLFHAVEGFDPPIPALRRIGVRTRTEIDREIYALKILRGDFDDVIAADDQASRVDTALGAVGL